MLPSSIQNLSQIYFKRFNSLPPLLSSELHADTKIIWVIPCYNEPEILTTLQSLADNRRPQFPVEILIVINSSTQDNLQVRKQNARSHEQIIAWRDREQPDFLSCHVLTIDELPPKHAGVGLARKIGMDEALRRFASIGYDGLIMNLDADCTVSSDYLQEVERSYLGNSPSTVTVYFEHDLTRIQAPELREGIIYYELFLRYYTQGLRYANFPFAFHTVGSCMGSRASSYAQSGGMNRRKAGEDFYFLHKVAPRGTVAELVSTTVYPSARTSDRVPFGTGKAQLEWISHSDRHRTLYHPQSFEDLKYFLEHVPQWYTQDAEWPLRSDGSLPTSLKNFLKVQDFDAVWNDLKSNTRSWAVFHRRFYAWWDGFQVLKFIHYARDHHYEPLRTEEAGFMLLEKLRIFKTSESLTAPELLSYFRKIDRLEY